MRRNQVAVVGAAETTELGVIPNMLGGPYTPNAASNWPFRLFRTDMRGVRPIFDLRFRRA